MRRMRDLTPKQYALIAGALALAFLIQFSIRKMFGGGSGRDTIATMRPSFYKHDSGSNTDSRAYRDMAANTKDENYDFVAVDRTEQAQLSEEEEMAARFKPNAKLLNSKGMADAKADAAAASTEDSAAVAAALQGNQCEAIEYRGDGPKLTQISKGDWDKTMQAFHQARSDLLAWFRKRHKEFDTRAADAMEQQMAKLQIERPPLKQEPELNWRGIGVLSYLSNGTPTILVSGGLVKLISEQPARGRFEMTRLVAQAWAPCELQKINAGYPWAALLKCFGIEEPNGCGAGTFSEGGWAVSSALSAVTASPGCVLPAFADARLGECLKSIPISGATAMIDGFGSVGKVARR